MASQEPDSSCGDKKVTLRELTERGNYIARSSQKWLRLFGRMNDKIASLADHFSSFVGTALKPADRRSSKRNIDAFSEELKRVKNDLNQRVKKFMPPEWHKDFCPLGEEVPDEPLEFANRLRKIGEKSVIGRAEFALLRAIVLAGEYFEIKIQRNDWEQQIADEPRRIRAFLKYMHIPEEAAKRQSLDFYLDPSSKYHCRRAVTEGAFSGRYTPQLQQLQRSVLFVDFTALFRKKVRAIVLTRKKGYLETFSRRFRDPQSELIPYVPDLFGVRLCYFDLDEMRSGIDLMSICASLHCSSAYRAVPQKNKHSFKDLHLVSQKVLMDGRYTEVQHMPVREWLNIEHSVGDENHTLYQMRWYVENDGLFANIFPPDIYHKNWGDELMRQKMREYIIENTLIRNKRDEDRLAATLAESIPA